MKYDFFYNTDHAYQYLSDSIIKIEGIPSIIGDVARHSKTFKIHYQPSYNPEGIPYKSILINDEAVDMSPICLGYFNKSRFENHRTFRVFRKPCRDWKIGLHSSNVKCLEYSDEISELLMSRYMFNLMTNNFPSFEQALYIINKKETNSVAFNRHFALKGYDIYYNIVDYKIGSVDKKGSFSLFEGSEYLGELLEKAVNNEN